ncbi:MAG: hypothetical protein EOP63_15975 [Sphingomonadales bacterium]|nr:MAG: hypothetical protein EOP63_15975 [Sphingomonadales bacterium]
MDFLIAAAAAATASPAPTVAAALVALPAQSISPADVAAYIDPGEVARFMPAPPPTTELVAVSDRFFGLLENITMVALFIVGFFPARAAAPCVDAPPFDPPRARGQIGSGEPADRQAQQAV